MQTITSVTSLRSALSPWRSAGKRIALVPTMGNLHAGHLALLRRARELADCVVASIFVNPLQFGAGEDFAGYPRTLEADSFTLAEHGLDLLFAPGAAEVYPRGLADLTRVTVPGLSEILCGVNRPIHFTGVATVVAMLFNMVQPHAAVFGEKDYQQLVIIRRMVADLHYPVDIVSLATVREPDGLAMSSRNAYLTAQERILAPQLYQVLCRAAERIVAGERDYRAVAQACMGALGEAGLRPEYCSVRRAQDLAEPTQEDGHLVVLAAARVGRARLIDNVPISL